MRSVSAGSGHREFMIAGHTSATGSAEHNQHLSEARARAVRSYLIEHFGIPPGRIQATGYGSSHPLPNFAPAALQQRRVEIIGLRQPPEEEHEAMRTWVRMLGVLRRGRSPRAARMRHRGRC